MKSQRLFNTRFFQYSSNRKFYRNQQNPQILHDLIQRQEPSKSTVEWETAKNYKLIPGPSKLGLIAAHFPGGELHNSNLVDMHRVLRKRYGDIFRLRGMMGKADIVFTYNARDFEIVYRNEGIWPIRMGLESLSHYRKSRRPEIFQGVGGLTSENGKPWSDIRNKVNPILLKIQNVRLNLPQIEEIANEFMTKIDTLLDPTTKLLKTNLQDELKMWSFESIAYIALNSRMGLMTDNPDPNMSKLANCMSSFFEASYKYDVKPSFWKYIETPGFKRLLGVYDDITHITCDYIDAAIEKFKNHQAEEAPQSVLEKLCRIDRQVAIVTAMDMLMGGIDTTSSAFITILYHIAKNPEKQKILRQELKTLIPSPNTPITACDMSAMVYLKACIKEGLRITPLTPGNFRMTIKDLVLSGYKVPKGTGVIMGVMALSNCDEYFLKSNEFIPERWLKTAPMACPAYKAVNPFVYSPFGHGARSCIGRRIAEMEMEILLAKIIRNYKVEWAQTEELRYVSNIILTPNGKVNFKFERLNDKKEE